MLKASHETYFLGVFIFSFFIKHKISGTVQGYKPYSSNLNANIFGIRILKSLKLNWREYFLINGDTKNVNT